MVSKWDLKNVMMETLMTMMGVHQHVLWNLVVSAAYVMDGLTLGSFKKAHVQQFVEMDM